MTTVIGTGLPHLFTKPNSGEWATATETAKLTASDGAADDRLGWSVTVDGDTVVGAYQDDDNGNNFGSAYEYEDSDWTAIPDSAARETNPTSYTVTGPTDDAEYDFLIRATNSVGTGLTGDAVSVTPASQGNLAPAADYTHQRHGHSVTLSRNLVTLGFSFTSQPGMSGNSAPDPGPVGRRSSAPALGGFRGGGIIGPGLDRMIRVSRTADNRWLTVQQNRG